MPKRHHIPISDGAEIIFNAPLDEVNTSKDLISGVSGTVTSGTFDSVTHSVTGSAVRYNGIVKWDLNGTPFPTNVQAAYTNGKTIGVSWEMYCTTNGQYATPFTIGTFSSTNNATRFHQGEGLAADPRAASSSNASHISTNTWVQVTYKTVLPSGYTEIMTSERPNFVPYATFTINCTANIIRYVNIFGKCWSGGGTWTGKMRNVLIWLE